MEEHNNDSDEDNEFFNEADKVERTQLRQNDYATAPHNCQHSIYPCQEYGIISCGHCKKYMCSDHIMVQHSRSWCNGCEERTMAIYNSRQASDPSGGASNSSYVRTRTLLIAEARHDIERLERENEEIRKRLN